MAAKKKAKKTAPKKFLAVWSDCGDDSQLEVMSHPGRGKRFASVEDAKKQASKTSEGDSLSGDFYIVEIVAEGKIGGNINWK